MFFFHAKGKVTKNLHEKEKKKAVAVELVPGMVISRAFEALV